MLDPYLGQINMVAFTYAPRGWAQCDGQLYPVDDNQALYAIIGNLYGGQEMTTFAVPDFRGRVPIHKGHGPGSQYNFQIGDRGGVEDITLDISTLPKHNHLASTGTMTSSIAARNDNANTINPSPNMVLAIPNDGAAIGTQQYPVYSDAGPDTTIMGGPVSGTVSIGDTGASQPHENMQPFLTVNFVISLNGTFPPRN